MAERLKTIHTKSAVALTLDDGTIHNIPQGISAQPAEIADHWYVVAHLVGEEPPGPGSEVYAKALRKVADERKAAYDEAEAQAAEAEHLFEEAAAKAKADAAAKAKAAEEEAAAKAKAEEEAKPQARPVTKR